jgi:ribosomal protein S18 acetylase RimI-like enzyme
MSDVRRLDPALVGAARDFFARIPEGDRTFFKEDVMDPEVIASWATDRRNERIVAVGDSGSVVGYLALIPGVGWSSHVGELRLVVDPSARGAGLGRKLARHGLSRAVQSGLTKVYVEVVADQTAAVGMFDAIGFEGEALLKDHVRDRNGELRDLMILSHGVSDNQALFATTGIDDALEHPTT